MQLVFATSNPHKLEEVQAILGSLGIDIVGLDSLPETMGEIPEPVEDGETFAANARIKAVYYATALGCMCLADDSGLEVDALHGEPGVRSARYAAESGTRDERDRANNAKLLTELQRIATSDRAARFICAMCLADSDGRVVAESSGAFEGVITDKPRGNNGFGYDPLLYLADVGCTSAQLTPEAKNARSHRGAAARAMTAHLVAKGLNSPIQ